MKRQREKIYSTRTALTRKGRYKRKENHPLKWMNEFIKWLNEEPKSQEQIIEYCKKN